jgi:ectoine hydroxylase-related dioxygenase (phytanoyl-CoA dioxygenase family)
MKHEPEAWLKSYRDDGFIVVEDLLEPATLWALRDGLHKIVEGVEGLPPHLSEKIFYERQHVKNHPHYYAGVLTPEDCGSSVRQIDDLALFGAEFAALICHRTLLDVMETLFGSSEFSLVQLYGRPKAARVGNGISNGNFHRDTPFEEFTHADTILSVVCLDPIDGENGATQFIRGSHRVSDEEAKKAVWREVEPCEVNLEERVVVRCPAGAGVFFNTKTLHAAGHNRSERTRYTIFIEWVGPDVLPTSPERHAFQGLRPRSREAAFARQMRMTFPGLSEGRS